MKTTNAHLAALLAFSALLVPGKAAACDVACELDLQRMETQRLSNQVETMRRDKRRQEGKATAERFGTPDMTDLTPSQSLAVLNVYAVIRQDEASGAAERRRAAWRQAHAGQAAVRPELKEPEPEASDFLTNVLGINPLIVKGLGVENSAKKRLADMARSELLSRGVDPQAVDLMIRNPYIVRALYAQLVELGGGAP